MQIRLQSIFLLILILLVGCTNMGGGSSEELTQVRLALPFRPDIQFAPFYVAIAEGYFNDVGLDVQIEHYPENEAMTLVGASEVPFAVVSGEQVLLARAQELPVVYVTAWWQDYPVAVAVPEESDIVDPGDLVGRKVGIPGLYGASYIGYRALLSATGVSESDTILDSIGYNQVEAMLAGQEDAVVIYANNEPVQLEAQGMPMRLIKVADYVSLASNGLITNESLLEDDPELVEAMIAAMLRGIEAVMEDPDAAYEISKGYVEGLDQADESIMKKVLNESIVFWRADRIGESDPTAWSNMNEILIEMGLLDEGQSVHDAYTNEFLPKQ
ncbi:MAG: ABC transporter substrate-binding protein [Anaerolineales bacterium]|nr:ABC transporter substrate-binding protein [Anaerolineales bacterium]